VPSLENINGEDLKLPRLVSRLIGQGDCGTGENAMNVKSIRLIKYKAFQSLDLDKN
jgi:hypothetical protein